MTDFSKIYLFRMMHIENIPHILQYGVTHISSKNANNSYVPIGDDSLIGNRNSFVMPNGKTLGQYIPFYFGIRMPMLYVIQNGFNGVISTLPEKIVYCISSVQEIINHKLPFVFSNGHAFNGFSDFFNENDIDQIDNIIDKNAIHAKYWHDENDLDLKRRKEAEFLIESDIPVTAIIGWIVFNEHAKSELERMNIEAAKIITKPDYYF